MNGQVSGQLTLFPAGSPASHFLLPGSEEARRMTVTSGLKCLELSRISGPLGLLARTLLESSAWRSTRCYLTWKLSATPARRLLFRLVPSTPRTEGTDARLWPTPTSEQCGMTATTGGRPIEKSTHLSTQVWLEEQRKLWPTPTSREYKGGRKPETLKAKGRTPSNTLGDAVMFATPTGRCGTGASNTKTRQGSPDLQSQIGGQLNPTWVEWLMGFPLGWTDLNA